MYRVVFADGATVAAKEHNLFHAARTHYVTPDERLTRLEDVASVQPGPYVRVVVATASVPADTLLTTTTLNVCLVPEEIAVIDARFAQWVRANLSKLMEREPKSSTIIFHTDYAPAVRFVSKLAQRKDHPIIAGLMQYDCFSHECLTLNLRRSCGPEFC